MWQALKRCAQRGVKKNYIKKITKALESDFSELFDSKDHDICLRFRLKKKKIMEQWIPVIKIDLKSIFIFHKKI